MRAKEFTINVPITITINGDDDPVVSQASTASSDLQQNPVMVTPLQQALELQKAELGKTSPVIAKLTQPDSIGDESVSVEDLLQRIKALIRK